MSAMTNMTNRMMHVTLLAALVAAAPVASADAQVGSVLGRASQAKAKVDQARDLIITEKEEIAMGAAISEKLRQKYGVVQNQAVHKYVTLVGRVVASSSAKPNFTWHFIVLDTDGVNAFAAPGGYVHITRGALALIRNESELAGVLGHEIAHVTEQHTIKAIKKSKWVDAGAGALTQNQLLDRFTQAAYENIVENGFDRDDENASDALGLKMANGAGYAPTGLGAFLTKLAERNKDLKERSGAFASHPETRSRLDRLKNQISKDKLTGAATVAERYTSTITYKPIPVSAITTVAPGATSPPADAAAEKKSGGSRFGVGSLTSKLGGEKTSDATVASAGSRGVNPDRDAKGGSNPRVVSVTVTAAEVAAFRTGIAG